MSRIIHTGAIDPNTRKLVSEKPFSTTKMTVREVLQRYYPNNKIEYTPTLDSYHVGSLDDTSSLFFKTVHQCFAEHHALVLRPEVLFHLVIDAIAMTVNKYPKEHHHLFSKSKDKITIKVRDDSLILGKNTPWTNAIASIGENLQELIPNSLANEMLPNFSTSSSSTKTASIVALMSSAQKFYDYVVETRCGIPRVILAGNPEDYAQLLKNVTLLSTKFNSHMGSYFKEIIPILKKLHAEMLTTEINQYFWQDIYKYRNQSGGPIFDGWLSKFVRFTKHYSPNVEAPLERTDMRRPIDSSSATSSIASAPFIWDYYGTEYRMLFVGGILHVGEFQGGLMPCLSYAVLHAN